VGSLLYVIMCNSEAKQQSEEGGNTQTLQETAIKRIGKEQKRLSFPENRSRIPTPRPHAQINEGNGEKSVKRRDLRGDK